MSGGLVRCPIVFRGPNGSAARVGAQHSQNYAAWYSHIPGLKVIAPYAASDAKALLKSAIKDPNPVVFLEHELLYGHSFEIDDAANVPIGKARIAKPGKDVTIVTFGLQVKIALDAAQILEENGIFVEVIDLRTIKPLDIDLIIDSVKKTNRLITLEESWFFSGVGATITALTVQKAFDYLDAPIINITAKEAPLPYAANLEKYALPSVEDVINNVKKILDNSSKNL
jgi:pyruvate dehydrogenase E1 component beta subunit